METAMTIAYFASVPSVANEILPPSQDYPAITTLKGGGYVISWQSNGQDGSGYGVYAQVFNALGGKVGSEILVNTTTSGDQHNGGIASLADGGFVVTWQGGGIFAQRFDASGTKIGSQTQVNTNAGQIQTESNVTGLNDGGYVVSWAGGYGFPGVRIFSQTFTADGSKVGGELEVAYNNYSQFSNSITTLNDGSYVIAWEDHSPNTMAVGAEAGNYIYLQRFTALGATIGSVIQVDNGSNKANDKPSITALKDGGYVVTWINTKFGVDIYAQRFDAAGHKLGGTSVIEVFSSLTNSNYTEAGVTALSTGGYVITWKGAWNGGYATFAQVYDAAGAKQGSVVRVGSTLGSNDISQVTALDNGSFVVTWVDGATNSDIYQAKVVPDNLPALTGSQLSLIHGTEDVTYVISDTQLLSGFTDLDNSHLSVTDFKADHGAVVTANQVTGQFTITTTQNYYGQINLTYKVTDGLASIAATQSVVFDAVNDAPMLTGAKASFSHGKQGVGYVVSDTQLLQGYTDVEKDHLSVTGLTAAGGTVTDNHDGTYVITPTATGPVNLSYGVSDGNLTTQTTQILTLNHAPAKTDSSATIGAAYQNVTTALALLAGYTDPEGDTLKVTHLTVSNGTVVDYHNGLFGFTPQAGYTGLVDFSYDIEDGYGETISVTAQTTVLPASVLGPDSDTTFATSDHGLNIFVLSGTNKITATKFSDFVFGGTGNDTINGGAGADTMAGGGGNDTYFVDNAGDQVVEQGGQGTDVIYAAISYTLGANVENITLMGGSNTATTATGNDLNNTMFGSEGNNTLIAGLGNDYIDGNKGADTMFGGLGDDIYIVDNVNDQVKELANQGNDFVNSYITYTLTSDVENLGLLGTANINGTGNSLNNIVQGNAGKNVITGGVGNDKLIGGLEADTFVFNNLATNGLDTITDFVSGIDKLSFGAGDYFLTGHVMTAADLSTDGVAHGTFAQFIFDPVSHLLMWDPDGEGGATAKALANLRSTATLAHTDFTFYNNYVAT
jgi:serralysin